MSPWNVKQCEAIVTLDGMQTEADLVADSLSERIRKPMTEMHTGLLPRERERDRKTGDGVHKVLLLRMVLSPKPQIDEFQFSC